MATLHFTASLSKSTPGLYLPVDRADTPCVTSLNLAHSASATHFNFRSKNSVGLLSKQKQRLLPIIYARNTNPSEESDVTKSSGTGRGPPILTILAGLLVFAAILWIFGSIVIWLFSIIVKVPQSK